MANQTADAVEVWFSESIDTLFGVLLGTMTIFGVIENFSVFGMFFKFRKEMSSRTTHLLMSLCVSDGLMALVGGTMFTISSFSHKWPFGYPGCVFYGVVMFTTGCGDIAHLAVIALDRMMAISSPIKYRAWAQKPILSVAAICFSWAYGFLWAFLPLVGLSKYAFEGLTSCSVDWMRKDLLSQLYIALIFVFCYFLPLGVMLFSYGFIFITVKMVGKKFAGDDSAASKKKRDMELKLAINFSLVMVVYMCAWTPYAVVSMIGVYWDSSMVPNAARGLPAVISKFSFVINPLLYVMTNKEHRRKLRSFFGMSAAVEADKMEKEDSDGEKKKKAKAEKEKKEDCEETVVDEL